MISFLLTISFLLHIVSLTAIYAMYKQLTAPKTDDTKDVIQLMEAYLEEIKLENERLQEELSQSMNHPQPAPNRPNIKVANPQISNTKEQSNAQETDEPPVLPIDIDIQDDMEVSLQSQILKLHHEGLSHDEIARKLGCGKTEVDLILKFHEKK